MTDVDSRLHGDRGLGSDSEAAQDPFASMAAQYAAAIAMTAFATIVAVGVETRIAIPNLSLVFVLPVIISGLSFGLGPSICAAVVGALSFNFFLTEPRYSLAVDDPANIWAIGLLFVVGLITSGVAFTSHRRSAEGALLRRQQGILEAYTLALTKAADARTAASITSSCLTALFEVPATTIVIDRIGTGVREHAGSLEPNETELEAARSALTSGIVARGGVYPNTSSRFDFWPSETPRGQKVVLGLAFDPENRPLRPDDLINIVSHTFGLLLDLQNGGR